MKPPNKPTTPTSTHLLLGLTLRVLAVIALVLVVQATGFGDAGDDVARHAYYKLRGQRDSSQQVILIAIDAPTLAAWGPPPYRAAQLDGVIAAVSRGRPTAIGLVDDRARLLAPADTLAKAVQAGSTSLALDATAIDSVMLHAGDGPTVSARILEAAGIPVDDDRIAINFVGARGLPTLSALEVARGNIPSASFAGKIVVVGLTAPPHAGLVPTPIGPLAPAQLQAHALASAADGASWTPLAPWLRWLLIALLCAVTMVLVHHLAVVGATIALVSSILAVLAVDYLLFTRGVSFGATLPLLTALAAGAIERVHERLVIRSHIDAIGHWTRQWTGLEGMRTDVPADEPAFWLRVATLARLYVGCTSTIVAELPPGSPRLKLRVINGTSIKHIAEPRRDIRLSPYRKAHLTLSPVWHDRFMKSADTATLLVPLVVRTQLLGFWIVNFPNRNAVTDAHMVLIKTLAHEIALTIERRRNALAPARPPGLVGRLLGTGRMSLNLADVRRSFDAYTQNQQELITLGESMPFGVFVATLWGEIRYMNSAMKLVCQAERLDPTNHDSLPDVLSRLTGFSADEVNELLRRLVHDLEELHVRGRDRIDRIGRDFVLSWLKPVASDPADAEQLILVCTLPRGRQDAVTPIRVVDRSAEDHDATTPLPRVDPLDANALQLMLASGTPTFNNDPNMELALALKGRRMPAVPEATLRITRPAQDPAITFVAAGKSDRSSRSLPILPETDVSHIDKTIPLFTKLDEDDLQ